MQKLLLFTVTLLAAAVLPSYATAATLSKADYNTAKTRAGADHKAGQALCVALKDNARDICSAEARGKQKVALAEVEFAYTGKAVDGNKLRVVTAEAAFAVAKEKCDDLAGNDKDLCVKKAKANKATQAAQAAQAASAVAAMKPATVPAMPTPRKEKKGGC